MYPPKAGLKPRRLGLGAIAYMGHRAGWVREHGNQTSKKRRRPQDRTQQSEVPALPVPWDAVQ